MSVQFPPLLTLSVSRHLAPKMRFLHHTLGVDTHNSSDRSKVPPFYFGARLEALIAPRHAFLMYCSLPHGRDLLTHDDRFGHFLAACRNTKRFAALCQLWMKQQHNMLSHVVTASQVEAFDVLFSRGLLAAARNVLVQPSNAWPLEHVSLSAAQLTRLLIHHGANPYERDHRGVTLLHWAAGTGNLDTLQTLQSYFNDTAVEEDWITLSTHRDGASLLHWAVAGVTLREFGVGGHVHVCQYLLDQAQQPQGRFGSHLVDSLVNQPTFDGNTPLMWAAWSGTLETVQLLIQHCANTDTSNRNGCTVAHWAASGGNLEVCRYLYEVAQVDFTKPNHGGNTPLTHAVAFGRASVVAWLRDVVVDVGVAQNDLAAHTLAKDFVQWTEGDARRRQVLDLFDEWEGGKEPNDSIGGNDEVERHETVP